MTLQFRHDKRDNPSSLILDLIVWNKFGDSFQEKGKIDTGASHTVIPDYLVSTLKLKKTREAIVKSVSGMESEHFNYFVAIQIGGIKFDRFEVVAMPKDYVLLGRDLINLWKLKIDGQAETYSIDPWSTNPDDVKQ